MLNRLPHLAKPLLHFNMPHEIRSLRDEEWWLRRSGRNSHTLVKYPDFRIVLVEMRAGTVMSEHRAEGRISIHCLAGKIRVKAAGEAVDLHSARRGSRERLRVFVNDFLAERGAA